MSDTRFASSAWPASVFGECTIKLTGDMLRITLTSRDLLVDMMLQYFAEFYSLSAADM